MTCPAYLPEQRLFKSPSQPFQLSYRLYGDEPVTPLAATSIPILFFHGNLNSSCFSPAFEKTSEICRKHNCMMVAIDRPGIGRSSLPAFSETEGYMCFARKVVEFVNAVVGSHERVGVIGFSSGGPYAFATTLALGNRVFSLSLLSSDAPYLLFGKEIVKQRYGSVNATEAHALVVAKAAYKALKSTYETIKKEVKRATCLTDLNEAVYQGFQGPARDIILETREWDVDITKLAAGTVLNIYHGENDVEVPMAFSKQMIEIIETDNLLRNEPEQIQINKHYIEGESHSLLRRRWDEILAEVAKVYNSKVCLIESKF